MPDRRFRPGLERCEVRIPLSTAVGHAVTFNRSAYPSERQGISAGDQGDYPYLGQNYQVLAPSSGGYNCISYSLGLRNVWIAQQMGPPRAPLAWMDHLYAQYGFRRLPTMDVSLDPGVRKVVLYGTTGRHGVVTDILHAEVQDKDGTWSSKLGDGPMIHYPHFNTLSGPSVGHPIAVYARQVD
jgi:type VI secretion system secreted protein VgrG